MKLSLNIGGRFIAIGTGLMIVLSSATLIRANGDDALDAKQTANLSVLARSERGDAINNKTLDNSSPKIADLNKKMRIPREANAPRG